MGRQGDGETRGWGDKGMGRQGDGETRGWGDKGMGRQGDGEQDAPTTNIFLIYI